MEWKKDKIPFEAGDIKVSNDVDETELQDEEYPAWQTSSAGSLDKKIFQKPDLPLKTIGIVLLVIIVAIIFLLSSSGSDKGLDKDKISRLENRIQLLENQLTEIDKALAKNSGTNDQTAGLAARLDRLEASLHSRMGQVTNQINVLKKQVGTKKTAAVVKKKTTKKTVQKPSTSRSHTVKSGDTLYDIARRYSVTVKQLIKWNKIPTGGSIYPGQKLKVGP